MSEGQSGAAGDILIKINVKPDPYFRRDNFDIFTTSYVTISQVKYYIMIIITILMKYF